MTICNLMKKYMLSYIIEINTFHKNIKINILYSYTILSIYEYNFRCQPFFDWKYFFSG